MNIFEKVSKGLECCISLNGGPMDHDCKECPYNVGDKDDTCISIIPMLEDAQKELKDYQGRLDIQTEKLVKTERQFQSMCDLSNMQMETLHEQEQAISELQKALKLIADIAYDFDGYDSVEGLKSLIDEIREIAIKGVQNADHRNLDTQCT